MRAGRDGLREAESRVKSVRSAASVAGGVEADEVPDVLVPDKFELDELEPDSTRFLETGLRALIVSDETGKVADWPWETGPTADERHTGGRRRRHRLDATILFASGIRGKKWGERARRLNPQSESASPGESASPRSSIGRAPPPA